MLPVAPVWQPPQSSTLGPNFTTLTTSPYFSPKSAMAPMALASSMVASLFSSQAKLLRMRALTFLSTSLIWASLSFSKWEKSKRRYLSQTYEPFCSTWVPRTSLSTWSRRWVQLWLLAIFCLLAASTSRVKTEEGSEGSFSAMCTVSPFSLTVLVIAILSPSAEIIWPVSPTSPPISP